MNRVKLTINASSLDKGLINLILTLLSTPLSVGTERSLTLTNLWWTERHCSLEEQP